MSLTIKEGTCVLLDLDSYFYKTSYKEGKGWKIRTVYNDEHEHFRINRKIYPGRPCPYHVAGKYGDLGWVEPIAIIRVVEVEYNF